MQHTLKGEDHAALDMVQVAGDLSLPISFLQNRLRAITRLDPGRATHNLVTSWTNNAGAGFVASALGGMVLRHRILRAAFCEREGASTIRLLSSDRVKLEIVDLGEAPRAEQTSRIAAALREAEGVPFCLAAEPPVRFTVYRLGDLHSATVVVLHRIAGDERTLALMQLEVARACAGETVPEPRWQFADLAALRPRGQVPGIAEAEVDWWRERLGGAPPLSIFSSDGLSSQANSRELLRFFWGADLTACARALANKEGLTIYAVLLAACATVLYRHTGQSDLVFSRPVDLRDRPEFETMFGPFVNSLFLRVDLSGNPSFAELLRRVGETLREADRHRHVPFESLLEFLSPARAPHRLPLSQIAFVEDIEPSVSAMHAERGAPNFALTWIFRDSGPTLEGSIEYRGDLFTSDSIAVFAGQIENVLMAAGRSSASTLNQIELMSRHERHRILKEFNPPQSSFPPGTFARHFERQVAMDPGAIAARMEGESISYGELNAGANQLARHLRELGVGPGALVGICMDRSLRMLVALLGIQKAGGAYLPLDPSFPTGRLSFMLSDSAARVLVTAAELTNLAPVASQVHVVDLDEKKAELAALDTANVEEIAGPSDTAYVIYTSGSTGQPKGVVITHGALMNFLSSMRHEPGLQARDVIAAVTTISFDIAGLELYLPLMVGAQIEIVSRKVSSSAKTLWELMAANRVTVLQATPATWRLLMEESAPTNLRLRAFCGGEALSRDLADAILKQVDELWNLYGPTETTIWSTVERVQRSPGPVTVGHPIANTSVYVLDANGEPAPVGVAGEIFIGGAGVARGYHGRPDLTEERFAPDPFSQTQGGRFYRTGDLGRWRADGRLEHLGRSDHQVKVRGFRIELGEVEAALGLHPSVKQALVVTWEVSQGDTRLVAYVVLRAGLELALKSMRDFLGQSLPSYMLPSRLITLESLPLTPNGKVDRRALPKPGHNANLASLAPEDHVPPSSADELLMTEIWSSLLKVEDLSVSANFFEIGGHSMLVGRLMAEIEDRFARKLPLSALMEAPTVRQLIAWMERQAARDSLVVIRPGGSKPPFFLVHDGDGETLLYRTLAYALSEGHTVYGLQPHSADGHLILHTRIPEMASYHLQKVRTAQPEGPYFLGGLCAGGVIAFEMARQLEAQGQSVALLALLDVADVATPLKSGRLSSKRFKSLKSSLSSRKANSSLDAWVGRAAIAATKLMNLLRYETASRLRSLKSGQRIRELRQHLDREITPPKRLAKLSVREVYGYARTQYSAEGMIGGRVVLFRATQGKDDLADEPVAEAHPDPMLGWERRVTGPIHAVDVPGGHVSMLQEPNVKTLAQKLQEHIDSALMATSAQPAQNVRALTSTTESTQPGPNWS